MKKNLTILFYIAAPILISVMLWTSVHAQSGISSGVISRTPSQYIMVPLTSPVVVGGRFEFYCDTEQTIMNYENARSAASQASSTNELL